MCIICDSMRDILSTMSPAECVEVAMSSIFVALLYSEAAPEDYVKDMCFMHRRHIAVILDYMPEEIESIEKENETE